MVSGKIGATRVTPNEPPRKEEHEKSNRRYFQIEREAGNELKVSRKIKTRS